MPRALTLCLSIVAAFPLPLSAAAAPPIAQAPITTAVAALAERVGMDLVRDRPRFVPEIIRRVYSPPSNRTVPLNLVSAVRESPAVLVDVPLTPELWSQSVFKRPVPADQWLAAILSDRRAALLCHGLYAADDETLSFYASHPALLGYLYERAAPAFAAFSDSIHVRDGRIVVPGGASASPLWQTLARASADDPEGFLRALFFDPSARLAYLYDVLADASPASRNFALGSWIADDALRVRRFQALDMAVRASYREWHVDEHPFARPLNDLGVLLMRVAVSEQGEPRAPAQRQYWATVFDASPALDPLGDAASASHGLVDAAWLLQATAGDMYTRGDRLDQLAFGQRVFSRHPDGQADVAAQVLHEMGTRRMLLLGLERLGITNPEVYASGSRQSRTALESGANRFWTQAQIQGALALLIRMSVTHTLDAREAEALTRSLFALPTADGELRGALAAWVETVLAPHLPAGTTWQERVIAAVAGGPTPGNPRVEWEGQTYRVDLAFAERRRIEEVSSRQGAPDLDMALDLAHLARRVLQASSIEAARPLVTETQRLASSVGSLPARPSISMMAPGVPIPRDARESLTRIADDIDRGIRTNDLRRIGRAGESLTMLGDIVLGHAVVSLVYAVHLGDPAGPALLGANVALRHDFGFNRRDGEGRARGAWAQPRQDFQPGVPWHVVGSLVGLDVALAPLSLHRLSMDGLAAPPRLPSIEREAFAVNVALLNPRELGDIDRDRIVDAIGRGRARVKALAGEPDVEMIERELALDGVRARSLRWVLRNDPRSMETQFSQAELLMLGGTAPGLDAWGASGLLSFGCVCTRFPAPGTWRVLAGRPQLAMMAASTVEMNLEIARRLAEFRLPAALLPFVLATAMQDFVDRVDTSDPNDVEPLLRYPRTLGRNQVADYIAATATLDGPLASSDLTERLEP